MSSWSCFLVEFLVDVPDFEPLPHDQLSLGLWSFHQLPSQPWLWIFVYGVMTLLERREIIGQHTGRQAQRIPMAAVSQVNLS